MADIPSHTKKPKKSVGFKPLPETLKPTHRRGHRVHLKKAEFDGELLPDHPEATNTRGPKGFYHSCNGGVEYHRTIPYIPNTMNDSKADLRSRSESPRRARAARERYWSYRVIHPDSQRNILHLDFDPVKDRDGNPYNWARLGLLPSQAPVIKPSKRQLFEAAQRYPRPPRAHYAVNYRRAGADNPRRMVERERAGASDEWSVSRSRCAPRKTLPQSPKPDEGFYSLCEAIYIDSIIDLEQYEDALVEEMKYGALDEQDYDDEDGAGTSFKNESDVDALFESAEQKYILKMAKKRKKLQKQGWDVWEAEDVMSPKSEAAWVEVDDEFGEWELEAAV
jgi:hypothetical protein